MPRFHDLPVDVPFKDLTAAQRRVIQKGDPKRKFGGLDGFFAWLDKKKYKLHVRVFAARYRSYQPCPSCGGARLRLEVLGYKIAGRSIADLLACPSDQLAAVLNEFENDAEPRRVQIAKEPLAQIRDRLAYLQRVGLGYLTLDRPLRTLSGGETQRIALTAALSSTLVGMLYVLDEPTAGLHPADVTPLIGCIENLRDRGNTVVAVEHNDAVIAAADRVIEFGPGAGAAGGTVTFDGPPAELADQSELTGPFLRGNLADHLPPAPARPTSPILKLTGAAGRNLQSIDVEFPIGSMSVVTGRSGSGKSTLVHDTLYPAVTAALDPAATASPLPFKKLTGVEHLSACELVDQSPISRTSRSCPVTYVKAMDAIRELFAGTVDARIRNYGPGHFSFNSADGQCPVCQGAGEETVDMQFLADVTMRCSSCRGRRYRDEVLRVRYRDRTIADVLEMTTADAMEFFRDSTKIQTALRRLIDVGLDYVPLGQPATTLSSGEGQRLKLAAFLVRSRRSRTLFLIDEPTTGLHFADVRRLLICFDALLADGHTLIVVEHHPMVMLAADHVIDLGPGAGPEGGRVVAAGTPGQVAAGGGETAMALRRYLPVGNGTHGT